MGIAWARGAQLDPELLPELLRIADGDDPPSRAHALTMIQALMGPAAIPRLGRALDDPVEAVAKQSLALLERSGPAPAALPYVRRLLCQGRESLHCSAVAMLASSTLPEAPEVLAMGLASPDVSARRLAAESLVVARAAAGAVRHLLHEPRAEVRAMAANVLGRLRDVASAGHLTGLLEDPEHEVVAQAALAIGRLRHLDARPRLLSLLEHMNPHVCIHAAVAIGLLGLDDDASSLAVVARAAEAKADTASVILAVMARMQ